MAQERRRAVLRRKAEGARQGRVENARRVAVKLPQVAISYIASTIPSLELLTAPFYWRPTHRNPVPNRFKRTIKRRLTALSTFGLF